MEEEESRKEIVSSLISLSETICENALKLRATESISAKDLVERGNVLQKRSKQSSNTANKRKRGDDSSSCSRTRNDVQVSCCEMEPGRKGYVKCTPLYDVDLKKTDSYCDVLSKICKTISGVDSCNTRLFNGKGAIIPDQKIVIRDKEMNWSLGGFLLKRHTSADKITLGVGSLQEEDVTQDVISQGGQSIHPVLPVTSSKSKRQCKEGPVTSKSKKMYKKVSCPYPTEASSNDTVKVYYAEEDSIVSSTRAEVWNKINGLPGAMDTKYGVFIPETLGFRVISISLLISNDCQKEVRILQSDSDGIAIPCYSEGKSPFCFSSCTEPLLTSLDPIPLVALSRVHPFCTYTWTCLNKPSMEFPSTPVIYSCLPFLYKCSVSVEGHTQGHIHFDIHASYQLVDEELLTVDDIEEMQQDDKVVPVPHPVQYELLSIPPPTIDSLQFYMKEIMKATESLSKSNEIGHGGYGNVYLAKNLRSIGTVAAIKVLTKEGSIALGGTAKQIENELKALMKFRHPNLLEIMGYCFSPKLKALVYRYIENGSLHSWIHAKRYSQLCWERRKSIMMDVLRGIAYLHAGSSPIVHQDIKSHNVLLDKDFNGIVGDFGFALEIPKSVSGRTLISAPLIARTEGYFPPELISGKISTLCDVYSCGVLALEVYTGLEVYCKDGADHELAGHTEDSRDDPNTFKEIADKTADVITNNTSEKFRKVTKACLLRYSKRPTANQVLLMWEDDIN